ncbi:MAG: pyridoxamine 5'-phosphate oxidase [Gemmataceae bacterium]
MSFVDPKIHPETQGLREFATHNNPIEQFRAWFQEAQAGQIEQPEAMTLATCTPEGIPSARMVLLRGIDERGFVFYTNYTSRKARELTNNPYAALVFFWEPMDRQVRIEGTVERTSSKESDAYYEQRPRGSRIGAWASPQSQVILSREELEHKVAEVLKQYGDEGQVPRPPFWGGFRVVPKVIEFWQGRDNRLHDRLRFRLSDTDWELERLAP